jgi:DNA replication and repair protein RecF
MRLQTLQLRDFRNFERLQIALKPRVNFLLGENGQGKTNLLESVHLLSRGISFRPADSQNFLRHGAFRSKVDGVFTKNDLSYRVELTIETGKKSAEVNGKRANAATLLKTFPTVLFSPESLVAIKEGPEQRRQLIDEILISHDPKQGDLLREHSKALKARNRLLRDLAEGKGSRVHLEGSLDSLNKIYFILAAHLSEARIKAIKAITPEFQRALTFITDGEVGDISVDYLISGESALHWSESQIYDAIVSRHEELQVREKNFGASLVGPHKHDIKFLLSGNDSRFYSSQGQQRALILALKIAQIVYHHSVHQTYPVLLLDDVLSELDFKKRANLMKFLEGISAQILITSTDLSWSEQFEGSGLNSVFTVSNGLIEQVSRR